MEIQLKLDVYNPAEFYGALGFLELVSQQDGSVTSHFESEGSTGANSTLLLRVEKDIQLPDLRAITATAKEFSDPLIAPVIVGGGLDLNWWLNQFRDDKSSLKMWAGNSKPVDMPKRFQQFAGEIDENVLQHSVKVRIGKSSFGFDTRASRDALAVGYSQKEAGDASVLYPETEFLCAIGLQNFRPAKDSYFVWRRPVPISIAHVAAIHEVLGLHQDKYTMKMGFVGQGLRAIEKVMRDGTNYANLIETSSSSSTDVRRASLRNCGTARTTASTGRLGSRSYGSDDGMPCGKPAVTECADCGASICSDCRH